MTIMQSLAVPSVYVSPPPPPSLWLVLAEVVYRLGVESWMLAVGVLSSRPGFWLLALPAALSVWGRVAWGLGRVLRAFALLMWLHVFRHVTLGWLLEVFLAWWFRGSQAPPPVLRDEVTMDPAVPMVGLASGRGSVYAQVANLPHASVAAGGLTPARLRARARWACRLQEYLGGRPGVIGRLVKGRWEPDLPSPGRPLAVNALLATLGGGAKLLGGGVLPSSDVGVHEPFVVVQTERGREVLVPSLYGRLTRYACFRPRDLDLLLGLKSRAQEWFREARLPECLAAVVLMPSVARAFAVSGPEASALDVLAEAGFVTSPEA